MTKTFKEKATTFILVIISAIGGFLVSEQIITGEQLAEAQGIIGMALSGGGLSVLTGLYILRTLMPQSVANSIVDKVGADKVEQGFNTIDAIYNELQAVRQELNEVRQEQVTSREEREQIKTDLNL